MNPLHVLLVTDDVGLAKGLSDALADHAGIADVEAVPPAHARRDANGSPDVVIVDDGHRRPQGVPPEELYPDSIVLRVRDGADNGADGDVEGHFRSQQLGYVRREDLEEVAPVIVALAGLSRVAAGNGAG